MISYKNLRLLFVEHDIKMIELVNEKVLTPKNSVVLNNDRGYVNLSTIDAVCNYLSHKLGRTVTIDEVVEFTPDPPKEKEEA